MANPKKLKKSTITSIFRTRLSSTPTPVSTECMIMGIPNFTHATAPFAGKDHNYYEILWDSKLNPTTNCYAFALGLTHPDLSKTGYYPGFISGKARISDVPSTADGLLEAVSGDLSRLKRKVLEVRMADEGQLPKTLQYKYNDGSYWIKLMQDKSNPLNWHFAMLDPNSGRWLHKMGYDFPPKPLYHQDNFKTNKEIILSQFLPDSFEKTMAEQMLAFAQGTNSLIPMTYYLEEDDSAGFTSIYRNTTIVKYEPVWIIRISG